MSWKCYLTIFKAESPIHIGYKQVGMLKTTRYYITGRAMWGAITANLTRSLFDKPSSKDYQAVGNFVKENIRTTYFYPAINKVDTEKWSKYMVKDYCVFMPEYNEEGLKFGEMGKEEFERLFIGSFVSTALDVRTKTAEEGSLHEFEYIQNKVELCDKVVQVYWVGYLFVNCNGKEVYRVEMSEKEGDVAITFRNGTTHESTLKNVLSMVFVGGERNYGFGKLRLCEFEPVSSKIFGRLKFELSNQPVLSYDDGGNSIAHVDIGSTNKIITNFCGEIEPLVGLEWSTDKSKGVGQKVSTAVICITPGSQIPAGKYELGEYGIVKWA